MFTRVKGVQAQDLEAGMRFRAFGKLYQVESVITNELPLDTTSAYFVSFVMRSISKKEESSAKVTVPANLLMTVYSQE